MTCNTRTQLPRETIGLLIWKGSWQELDQEQRYRQEQAHTVISIIERGNSPVDAVATVPVANNWERFNPGVEDANVVREGDNGGDTRDGHGRVAFMHHVSKL